MNFLTNINRHEITQRKNYCINSTQGLICYKATEQTNQHRSFRLAI